MISFKKFINSRIKVQAKLSENFEDFGANIVYRYDGMYEILKQDNGDFYTFFGNKEIEDISLSKVELFLFEESNLQTQNN